MQAKEFGDLADSLMALKGVLGCEDALRRTMMKIN